MNQTTITGFNIIGISVRTNNEEGASGQDIPALWGKFMTESIAEQIPNKTESAIYCIYTDYENDHTKAYTAILGCKVKYLDNIPHGMIGRSFEEAKYVKYVAKGNVMQGAVFNEWTKVWNSNLDRTFIADFEVYGQKAQDFENAEVDIFVGVS